MERATPRFQAPFRALGQDYWRLNRCSDSNSRLRSSAHFFYREWSPDSFWLRQPDSPAVWTGESGLRGTSCLRRNDVILRKALSTHLGDNSEPGRAAISSAVSPCK